MLPVGQITSFPPRRAVQCESQKFSAFPDGQITVTNPPVSPRQEGRLAIVTDAGRDAVDADALLTNGV
jgi:hypothetical protein